MGDLTPISGAQALHQSRKAASEKVYLILDGSTGCVKIGRSKDVGARFRTLQTSSPSKLEILRVVEGGPAVEKWMHRRFSDYHHRGEWFHYCDDMATVQPPDEILKPVTQTLRRDVRLTAREKIKQACAQCEDIQASNNQKLLILSGSLTDDQAGSVLAAIKQAFLHAHEANQ